MPIDDDRGPDELLPGRLAAGDAAATAAFVDRFLPAVFGLASAITADRDAAEALTLRAFEQARRPSRPYDPADGPVLRWLAEIVGTLAGSGRSGPAPGGLGRLLTAMSAGPRPRPTAAHGTAVDGTAADGTAAGGTAAGETAAGGPAAVRRTLARLPATEARAVAMACAYGMTTRQIAGAEGIPAQAARTRLAHGMRALCDARRPTSPG